MNEKERKELKDEIRQEIYQEMRSAVKDGTVDAIKDYERPQIKAQEDVFKKLFSKPGLSLVAILFLGLMLMSPFDRSDGFLVNLIAFFILFGIFILVALGVYANVYGAPKMQKEYKKQMRSYNNEK